MAKLSVLSVEPASGSQRVIQAASRWSRRQNLRSLELSDPLPEITVPAPAQQVRPSSPSKTLSRHFRTRRDHALRKLILDRRATKDGTFRILDLGGTADYWRRVGLDWLKENQIEITCVNHHATEFRDAGNEEVIRFIVGNACDMAGHADNSFDFVHSNSVIEHVGRWPEMRAFAREVMRLAPAYYVQTPYYWFPIDPHFHRAPFFHWLPESARLKLLQRFKIGWAAAQPDVDKAMNLVMSNILLDGSQFRALFPDAQHSYERVAGLNKSLIAVKNPPS